MASIDSMTEGVSESKVSEVIEAIKTKLCTEAANALENNSSIIASLRDAWSGADCEAFITNFNNAIKEACDTLTNYETQIEAALRDIPQQWKEFQTKHITSSASN